MGSKLTLFTFLDAFGWEVYKRYGFLNDYMTNVQPLKTTFGFSSGADPSILTGRYPDEHTHWSSFYYSPETSPFKAMKVLDFLPSIIFDRWRVRHWASKFIAKYYGFTGYFQIYSVPFSVLPYFDYLEKKDYFVPNGILKTDTIFDYCYQKKIPYFCSNWRLGEKENLKIAIDVIEQGKVKFLYLILPHLDAVMHKYGPQHPKVEEKIRWLEVEVRKVINKAKEKYDEVSFYGISDHGMAKVVGSIDLKKTIDATNLNFGKDYIAMYDSTMARFWFKNKRAENLIIQILQSEKLGRIINDDELKKMHVFFADRKFGELFFLMNPGYLINPSFMGLNVIPGMHGYHPDDVDSYSFIGSNREISSNIKSITDIRKTMEMEI